MAGSQSITCPQVIVLYVMKMQHFSFRFRIVGVILAILLCLVVLPVSGADEEIEAKMGETITLHGFSYIGDKVYLFMTGPGLAPNGVTLTDTSLRADQGHFTVVGVDDNQEWTYIWKTSRISTEVDPGTYTVYVTNEPADLSSLGGSYKTLSVFLQESGESKVSIGAQHVYTLNPEENDATPRPAPSINITATPPQTTSAPPTTVAETPTRTSSPAPTRSGIAPWTVAAALVCGVFLTILAKSNP